MAKDMLVFQDMILRSQGGSRSEIRETLLKHVTAPWSYAKDKEDQIAADSGGEDILVFAREKSDDIEAVGLFLWAHEGGYKVTNIVPRDVRELGFQGYNAALQDFVARIAEPASRVTGLQIEMTPERQSLNDWIPASVAEALRRFSGAANKSTGSSHPSDRERWFEFLFAAFREPRRLDTGRLVRWLIEIEGWPDEEAHDLAIEYEFGLALLEKYENSRS